MELNINKCSVFSITLKRNYIFMTNILGTTLRRVTNHDYLGVTMSSDLNWLRHVTVPSRVARILTAAQGHSCDWIAAYPIAHVWTRLDDETLRISVALQVGLNVCLAHQCRCGATVQSDGLHQLSCRFSAGRFPRHSAISNITKISLDTAGLHSILEPVGLDRGDGRRPDGVT